MRRLVFTLTAALSFAFTLPSLADDLTPPPQGAIYIGNGRMLEAAPPRQLSLNANVLQFTYQPGGLEISYMGMQVDGNKVTQSILLVGLKHGDRLATLLSQTAHVNADGIPMEKGGIYLTRLEGWSGDGRYLLVAQDSMATVPGQDETHSEIHYLCIDVGRAPVRITSIDLPHIQDATQSDVIYWWSPDRTRLLFAAQNAVRDGDKYYPVDRFAVVYSPSQDRINPISLPEKTFTGGWLDNSHLLIVSNMDTTLQFFDEDPISGKQTEIAKPTKMPSMMGDANAFATPVMTSPKSPLLELEDEAKMATDEPKTITTPFHTLWVRRTKGIKPLSVMPVGLTPGDEDPQACWSPTGNQIAFIAHGDLFVTDLSEREATVKEKLAAGDLSCSEERDLASSYLKQIGLGLLQYLQDNDAKYPESAEMEDKVMPYLKDESLFNVGGHRFVYHAPPGMTLASIDAPADTILGTMDLPCAQIVLYADGHVKALPKESDGGATPGGAGR